MLKPSLIEKYAADIADESRETGCTHAEAMARLVEPKWVSEYVIACALEADPDGEPRGMDLLAPGSAAYEAARRRARALVSEAVLSAAAMAP